MSDDEDYLTDLTSSDSDDGSSLGEESSPGKAKGKGKKKSTRGEWKVRRALKPSRATTYTTQALHDQILVADIDLEPDYQREVVWEDSKQIKLIDSIFRNYYIPPVIFAVTVHDDGSESKTCIDGKQRLTSISRFMSGLIPHADPVTGQRLWWRPAHTGEKHKSRKILPEKYRKVFANKQVVCVEYHDIDKDDEREVFQRVQLGMALTPAEKLQASASPRTSFIRSLLAKYIRGEGPLSPNVLKWTPGRGVDFRCVAESLYLSSLTSLPTTSWSYSTIEKYLSSSAPLDPSFESAVGDSFAIFAALVTHQDEGVRQGFEKYKKYAPIEFIFTALFLYRNRHLATSTTSEGVYSKKGLTLLAEGVESMRDQVRQHHVDVRSNSKVQKTFFAFVRNWKAPGPGASSGKGKRKRAIAGDDDDEDEEEDFMEVDPPPKAKPAKKVSVKAEPSSSTPALARKAPAPKPRPKDRLAPLKAAKETALKQREAFEARTREAMNAQAAGAIPLGRGRGFDVGAYANANANASGSGTGAATGNPQQLPSPPPPSASSTGTAAPSTRPTPRPRTSTQTRTGDGDGDVSMSGPASPQTTQSASNAAETSLIGAMERAYGRR